MSEFMRQGSTEPEAIKHAVASGTVILVKNEMDTNRAHDYRIWQKVHLCTTNAELYNIA